MPPAIGKVLEPSAPAVASGSPPTIRRRREDDFGGHAIDISRFPYRSTARFVKRMIGDVIRARDYPPFR
jgi:hypothetical protein